MSEEIRPALTADEWAEHREHQRTPGYYTAPPNEQHCDMALANDELSDGDARKITWRDVEVLNEQADRVESVAFFDMMSGDRAPEAEPLRALAAKLAAILSPPLPPQDPADAADRLGRRMGV